MAVDVERRVRADALLPLVTEVFLRCGMRRRRRRLSGGSLVDADLRGVHSHGVLRVPEYVKKLTVGGVDPRGRPSVVRDVGACLVVDGGNSMGQIGTHFAMERAIERAADAPASPRWRCAAATTAARWRRTSCRRSRTT